MVTMLAAILMGWPAILGSLGLSAWGIVRRSPAWLIGGAILSTGFGLYLMLGANLWFSALGFALPLLHLGGAAAVRRQRTGLAWLLLVPHALIAPFLAMVVLSQ
ncbi:MAG TPA: hypothetical protein VK191_12145 [Symbiobacteriaceae bacterium]|nr:hypothetical protein [Symbiobacteriaceae bacterium]